ncbi:MAG: hypothetical protein M3O34_16225 [Chloroflexota bacterium]|nr:hypothetical protein [Chloroflexota bacterium]
MGSPHHHPLCHTGDGVPLLATLGPSDWRTHAARFVKEWGLVLGYPDGQARGEYDVPPNIEVTEDNGVRDMLMVRMSVGGRRVVEMASGSAPREVATAMAMLDWTRAARAM